MQGFMMYMSGGGVQIFSMMMVWMLIKNAIGAMLGVNKGKDSENHLLPSRRSTLLTDTRLRKPSHHTAHQPERLTPHR